MRKLCLLVQVSYQDDLSILTIDFSGGPSYKLSIIYNYQVSSSVQNTATTKVDGGGAHGENKIHCYHEGENN